MTGKQVELRCSIDPEIIGGIVARIGDQVVDGSVRNKLDDCARGWRRPLISHAAATRYFARAVFNANTFRKNGKEYGMAVRATEISDIIRQQIAGFERPRRRPTSARSSASATVSPTSTASAGDGLGAGRVPAHRHDRASPSTWQRIRSASSSWVTTAASKKATKSAPPASRLGPGRRCAGRPRGQRARPADRRQGPDRHDKRARSSASRPA